MADMTPLADILNGDDADATPVQSNFQTIETYINGTDLVRTDGTEVMAANLDMDGNKVVNLADGSAADDAVNKGQMDALVGGLTDYEVTSGGTTILTTATIVDTLTIEAPSAGMGLLVLDGDFTTTGITYSQGEVSATVSVSGATLLSSLGSVTAAGTEVAETFSNTVTAGRYLGLISLASGTNTVVVQLTRVNTDNGAGAPSGGTLTADTGFRTGIVGMF